MRWLFAYMCIFISNYCDTEFLNDVKTPLMKVKNIDEKVMACAMEVAEDCILYNTPIATYDYMNYMFNKYDREIYNRAVTLLRIITEKHYLQGNNRN